MKVSNPLLGNSTVIFPTKKLLCFRQLANKKVGVKQQNKSHCKALTKLGNERISSETAELLILVQLDLIPDWLKEVTHCFPPTCLTTDVTPVFTGKAAMCFWFRWFTML